MQLQALDDWAAAAEPHPVLLFEAIGGTGKSMLTWEWTTRHANRARTDWAGILWYSFYERGAVMADFCRHALAYMTGRPLADFRKIRQEELTDLLMRRLRGRPWLLIMDGLERVLVAYHRADAAQLPDEAAGGSDEIARRDPCAAIRPEDDRLLRELAGARPSKILMTSRLVPLSMWNQAKQPIPGVLHEVLPGLRPGEAEALLRSGGVRGDSERIRAYLQAHCACHPLVTGVVAGLVQDYLPDRGNFDAWESDPREGGRLNLAELDLVQKRNHILRAAIEALPRPGRDLLSVLALLSESVDYPTLSALGSVEGRPLEPETVRDLERRGLLQYDRQAGRYDLHPVVRGVAVGALRASDREEFGERALDYFSSRTYGGLGDVKSREDLTSDLTVVRVLMHMGRFDNAAAHLIDDVLDALIFILEENTEVLSLSRPFFTPDWNGAAVDVNSASLGVIASAASIAFDLLGEHERALSLNHWQVQRSLGEENWNFLAADLRAVARNLSWRNRLTEADRVLRLSLRLAYAIASDQHIFLSLLSQFRYRAERGDDRGAEHAWQLLDPMGRSWPRSLYRPGDAELSHCLWAIDRGRLGLAEINDTIQLSESGLNRSGTRRALGLRGRWRAQAGDWAGSADDFLRAAALAREVGLRDSAAEVGLALARLRLGDAATARSDAERLTKPRDRALLDAALLWHALGDLPKATALALDGHRWAWADGEPFVHRHELDRSVALLTELGVPVPTLPTLDPARMTPFAWEPAAEAAIARLEKKKPV